MTKQIRVFISSTMDDLANEREAVADAVRSLNFEPVMAERMLPDGRTIWESLEDDIDTCDLFILLLGQRYGWEPQSGYGAGSGKSVTHLEVLHARKQQVPILAFAKCLADQETPSTDEKVLRDQARRDGFRADVGNWQTGGIVRKFRLYKDLETTVRDSLLKVFADSYLKHDVRAAHARRRLASPPTTAVQSAPLQVPRWLAGSDTVLFAGAGVSVSAGLPTAGILADVLVQKLGLATNGEAVLQRYRFADVAALAEKELRRKGLLAAMQEAFDILQTPEPTVAHRLAVRLFSNIVTTNYDDLFERACQEHGLEHVVYTSRDVPIPSRPGTTTIFKLDGSIARPETLVLTDPDSKAARSNTHFWVTVMGLIAKAPVAVVGHSVRDTTSRGLLDGRRPGLPGVYVAPDLSAIDDILLARLSLDGLSAKADDFMEQLFALRP